MIGIIKGDARYEALAKLMSAKLSGELCELIGIEGLILPLGGIDDYYNIKQSNLNLLDILKENDIKWLAVGNANNKLKELCLQKNIILIELLKDSKYVMENARLTAEGILSYLASRDVGLKDQQIVILGYGNIGYYLAELLKAYQTKFQIYPSNELEKKYVLLAGYEVADFKSFDVAINTIPALLDWNYQCFQNKRIIDVASSPYGFDVEKTMSMGIRYEIFSAVPAKYAPYSAAKIIQKTIEKRI